MWDEDGEHGPPWPHRSWTREGLGVQDGVPLGVEVLVCDSVLVDVRV